MFLPYLAKTESTGYDDLEVVPPPSLLITARLTEWDGTQGSRTDAKDCTGILNSNVVSCLSNKELGKGEGRFVKIGDGNAAQV